MNKRQIKKAQRNSTKHGNYAWERSISKFINAQDEYRYFFNNWRKNNDQVMLRRVSIGKYTSPQQK